eukprot:CAMPEP_0197515688 /NCGR_PEP_ID=MMETSP1318-20131121/740_1 /TAXON_ID=552666 /ORGANISM="Partenskyella glossopodia, Strain RCC365" /LENGTH=228 /DNA_ID=CAMNT_0043064123 /DNA_START=57 /DNA_END=743 /DNA_ORIENTATION=+
MNRFAACRKIVRLAVDQKKLAQTRGFANLIGAKAPDFTAMACMEDNTFKEISLSDYAGKPVVMYFYPADFTFVCSSELPGYAELKPEFDKLGAQLIGVSTDTHHVHKAWKNASSELGGLADFDINHPLIGDYTGEVCELYDVIQHGDLDELACRAVFLIDADGTVMAEHRNAAPLGRNTKEALRMLQALKEHETTGKVIPADWTPGGDTMDSTTESVEEYLKKLKSKK